MIFLAHPDIDRVCFQDSTHEPLGLSNIRVKRQCRQPDRYHVKRAKRTKEMVSVGTQTDAVADSDARDFTTEAKEWYDAILKPAYEHALAGKPYSDADPRMSEAVEYIVKDLMAKHVAQPTSSSQESIGSEPCSQPIQCSQPTESAAGSSMPYMWYAHIPPYLHPLVELTRVNEENTGLRAFIGERDKLVQLQSKMIDDRDRTLTDLEDAREKENQKYSASTIALQQRLQFKEDAFRAELKTASDAHKKEMNAKEEALKAELVAKEEAWKAEMVAKEEAFKAELKAKQEVYSISLTEHVAQIKHLLEAIQCKT